MCGLLMEQVIRRRVYDQLYTQVQCMLQCAYDKGEEFKDWVQTYVGSYLFEKFCSERVLGSTCVAPHHTVFLVISPLDVWYEDRCAATYCVK